jgi:hypothetical protein
MVCAFGMTPSALPRNDVVRHLVPLYFAMCAGSRSLFTNGGLARNYQWVTCPIPRCIYQYASMGTSTVPEHPRHSHLLPSVLRPQTSLGTLDAVLMHEETQHEYP